MTKMVTLSKVKGILMCTHKKGGSLIGLESRELLQQVLQIMWS